MKTGNQEYLAKLSFGIEGDDFPDKQQLGEFIATGVALQKC